MDTKADIDPSSRTPHRRRQLSWLWGAACALLLVAGSRFVTSDLRLFSDIVQRSCQGGLCVERVQTPELLFIAGTREIRIGHDGGGKASSGTQYVEHDPFGESSDVTIAWNNAEVSISDGTATLTWTASILTHLDE